MRRCLTLILAALLVWTPVFGQTPEATPASTYDPADLLAIKPELRDQVAAHLPAGMTTYDIHIEIPDTDPVDTWVINGRQQVVVTNTTDESWPELPFRLYANGPSHLSKAIEINSISINDSDVSWVMSENDSLAMVPIENGLAPGASVALEMTFTLTLPVNEASHYGILNYSTDNETAVLAHWYPVLAGRDPATGWMLKPSSEFGDPIFTDAAMYDVSISAPAGYDMITSGIETGRDSVGQREAISFNAKPSRDFVIVLSQVLESIETEENGTKITTWALSHHQGSNELVADWTSNAISVFEPLLGQYPWVQLHVVEAPVYGASAVEFPQMFVMGSSFYVDSQMGTSISFFEFTVAHEAVHMWFYSLVGNNQYDDAFIDEGLTNYLSADVYFRHMYGDEIGDIANDRFLFNNFRRVIESNADVIVDFPTDDFPTSGAYVTAVYTKAPLGFAAIHDAMGSEDFFGALSAYVEEFSFRVATPSDLEMTFQAHTSVDIGEIWSHWFERREGGLDIRGDAGGWNERSRLRVA